jgi:hypothetical protein
VYNVLDDKPGGTYRNHWGLNAKDAYKIPKKRTSADIGKRKFIIAHFYLFVITRFTPNAHTFYLNNYIGEAGIFLYSYSIHFYLTSPWYLCNKVVVVKFCSFRLR